MADFKIRLSDLRFNARIGVSEQERRVGNDFRVDLEVTLPASAFRTECLDSTISYADLYELIRVQMCREWLLLESVAMSITSSIKSNYNQVSSVAVTVTKVSVPITGMQGEASVTLLS